MSLIADDPYMERRAIPVIAALLVAAVVIAACGGASAERQEEPDRVVNVVLRCATPSRTESNWIDAPDGSSQKLDYVIPAQEQTGEICERLISRAYAGDATPDQRALYFSRINARRVVTVRTAAGGSYTIEVSADTRVAVGDHWPLAEQ